MTSHSTPHMTSQPAKSVTSQVLDLTSAQQAMAALAAERALVPVGPVIPNRACSVLPDQSCSNNGQCVQEAIGKPKKEFYQRCRLNLIISSYD